ncbi:MAG: FAD-dependent oxidoreductase [Bacteroidetes bacterium]|nr:FAD-dependent oxidoreductase [Bacteroidota bacterium]
MVIRTEVHGTAGVVFIDRPPVNAINGEVRSGIVDAITTLNAGLNKEPNSAPIDRIVLCGANSIFAAGADAGEFNLPPIEPGLPEVVATIENSALPVIAAIRGACLGGGLELALGCRARIADTKAQLGLPEVILGVVPGSGGTQRLPRLIGIKAALSMVPEGRAVNPTEALKIGLIDAIENDPLAAALTLDLATFKARPPISAMAIDELPADELSAAFASACEKVSKKLRGQRAPVEAIGLLERAVSADFVTGTTAERAMFLELRGTVECAALRHVFFAERGARVPYDLKTTSPASLDHSVVVGGGTMGAGIAYAMAQSGSSVTLVERDDGAVSVARDRVAGLFSAAVKRGLMTADKAEAGLAAMNFQAGYEGLAHAGLAIEAVFEDMDVKRQVLTALDKMMPNAVLASNTSYLDIDAMAGWLTDPSRLIGLHFFSPAHIMKLLEIVRGKATSKAALATGFALAKALRKLPVVVGVCDGFVGNRMLQRVREAAELLILDGAEFTQIDKVMREFGYAMGLYMTQDLSGLDIAWANRKRQAETRDPRRRYSRVQDLMCEEGYLGRKTGAGWYIYEDGKSPVPNPAAAQMIEAEAARQNITRRAMSDDEVLNILMLALINEAASLLGEGIAGRASDVDLVLVHGYGFPRFRGGPLFHADQLGIDAIHEQLKALEASDPVIWKIAPMIKKLAEEGRGFTS